METFSGDTEESTEDIPGRKKSKLKSLRTRLFGRHKKAGEEGNSKLSQSASDITAGKTLGSDEDLVCSQGMMGSRALSHDSIFLADQTLTDAEPARVLSQENVHSKIKALQEKLQQQKLHLGVPPPVLPMRRPEDPGSRSEDDILPHSPSEISAGHGATQGVLNKAISQLGSHPHPSIPKPAPTKSVSPTVPILSNSSPPVVEPPLDFSSPAQFTPCLDTSAARHRMSVKPRNQRASTKKRLPGSDSGSSLHNLNNTESLTEEELQLETQAEKTVETEKGGSDIPFTSRGPSKVPEPASAPSETAPKTSSLGFSQQDSAPPVKALPLSSQVLRNKPHRPVDVIRPHSSYVQSDLMEKTESTGDFDIQIMTPDKRETQNKGGAADSKSKIDQFSSSGSAVTFRSSGVQGETENTRGIKRPAPGSGSFHFSVTTAKKQEAERPRSGSFVGVLENTGARLKTGEGKEDTSPSVMREKEDVKDLRPRGGPADVGRLRQEGALHKSPVLPWDRDSLKKVESVTQSKNIPTETGAVDREELEGSQESVEEAVEAKEVHEEEGKTAFGVKLRSTSQSVRLRPDVSSYQQSKSKEEQRQEISNTANFMAKKQPVNISCAASTPGDTRPTGSTAPSAVSFPLKYNLQPTGVSHVPPTEVKTEVEAPQEPQPAPQTASPEVSWMSLAMEKTRSLQSLFTSRFPRDFTGVQTAARPQTQAQTTNQTQTETQTTKSTTPLYAAGQPSTDAVKAETPQSKTQEQTVKPSQMPKVSPVESNTSKETPKQTEPQLQPNVAEPAPQTNTWTSPSPLRSTHQTETTSQFAQSSLSSGQHPASQHPPWSNRSLHTTNQLKPTPSASTAPPAPSSVTAAVGEESAADAQEKDGQPPPSGRRAVWGGSVSQKAAFLEKRTASPGAKGVEVKKTQTDVQSVGETSAQTTPPLTKDTKPEGSQGVKQAESSPAKVPERPREEKWLRKNMAPSSSPSSSPTLPSALSDSGQPSWMELAKRKSMAWSDKTMD